MTFFRFSWTTSHRPTSWSSSFWGIPPRGTSLFLGGHALLDLSFPSIVFPWRSFFPRISDLSRLSLNGDHLASSSFSLFEERSLLSPFHCLLRNSFIFSGKSPRPPSYPYVFPPLRGLSSFCEFCAYFYLIRLPCRITIGAHFYQLH